MTNKRVGCSKMKEVNIVTCIGNCLLVLGRCHIQVPRSLFVFLFVFLGGKGISFAMSSWKMIIASWMSIIRASHE